MNFQTFTSNGKTFTSQDQADAFEAYINQDNYLSKHRGEYAERGAVFLPIVKRIDLSISQQIFHDVGGRKHSGQIRLDITNFGNLLNKNWGIGQSIIQNRILAPCSNTGGTGCTAGADANGAVFYRLATTTTTAGTVLVTKTFQPTAGISDV